MSQKKKKSSRNRQSAGRSSIYMWVGIAAALVLLTAGAIFVLNRPGQATGAHLPAEVDVQAAVAMRDQGAFVLDVRQPEEWVDYHIPGTTLIPLDQLESRLSELPKDQAILVVCRSGNRSATGRDILLQAGFDQVTSLAGGLNGWRAAGYEWVSGE